MSLEWEQVVVDAAQPAALGLWWANVLGWVVTFEADDEYEIRPTPDRLPGLVFVPVRDSKVTKNRLHLDFRPDNQAAEVDRLLALGAHRVDVGQGEQPWVVLADPEGNEFCVLAPRRGQPPDTHLVEGAL
jgi:Glyoxalase-like domain